jgi:hypothetical protein
MQLIGILVCTLAMDSRRINRGLETELLVVPSGCRVTPNELLLLSDLVLVFGF